MERFYNKDIDRRDFCKGALATAILAATGLGSYELSTFAEYDPSNPIIDVVYQRVPGMIDRAHVIHLTDIHFGGDEAYVNAQVLQQIVARINQTLYEIGASPDNTALVMTGDWVSKREKPRFHIKAPQGGETNPKEFPVMLEILKDLRAEHLMGTFGNHDIKHPDWRFLMKNILESGIKLLDVDNEFYKGDFAIPIIGIMDFTEYEPLYTPSLIAELANLINSYHGPTIVATHNASVVDISGLGNLVKQVRFICGHTHGGHTKHGLLLPYALSHEYNSQFVRGIHRVGKNLVQIADGVGQQPQAAFRQIPAGIIINVYGG